MVEKARKRIVSKILLFLATILYFICSCNSKLIMVYQVGRHGYRSSKIKFEGLIEDETQNFKRFHDLLTSYGLKQTFERGEGIMKRYQALMNNTDFNSINTRSSFKSRAKLSALSQLLGMFGSSECKNEMKSFTSVNHTLEIKTLDEIPQKLRQCLSEFLPYIDIKENAIDTFHINHTNCTLYSTLKEKYTQDEISIMSNLEQKIMEWSKNHYKIDKNKVSDFCGIFRCLYAHEIKFKPSVFKNDSDIIDLCINYSYEKRRHAVAGNQIISLLYCNEQLKYIMNAIELAANQYKSGLNVDPVFYFDSCHDSNIYAIMIHLGNEERIPLKFGSSLFFELHEDDITHKLNIKMFLDDDQLTVNKNELCLKIEDGDKTIEKSVSTFNPLLHLIEPEDKNSSLNYFKKLVKSK